MLTIVVVTLRAIALTMFGIVGAWLVFNVWPNTPGIVTAAVSAALWSIHEELRL